MSLLQRLFGKRKPALQQSHVIGSLPNFEETFKRQLYDAGDTQDFKRSGCITVNELWLRNFHKIAQGKPLRIHDVSGSVYRYPMTYDQPCQIDCRVTSCKFYKGAGKCENVSPAITLNENGKFVCWSQADR